MLDHMDRLRAPWTGTWADGFFGTPLTITLTCLVGVMARFVIHRLVDRVVNRIVTGTSGLGRPNGSHPHATALLASTALHSARREQRARTTASVLKNLTTAAVGSIVALTVLDELSIPVAPLLASAGIVGIAVGFGAQSLVKDVISGLFMIVEDQYGVGDVVDLGSAIGTVEWVGLRVTRLRDVEGTAWYLRNGEVLRVGNRSQGWARAVIDIGIAHDEDLDRAQRLLLDVATALAADSAFAEVVTDEPQVWGIEDLSADGVVVRLVVRTRPLQQWAVARELRRRIKDRFDAEQVKVNYPPATPAAPAGPTNPERRP